LNQTRLLSQNLLSGYAWQVLRQFAARWLSARWMDAPRGERKIAPQECPPSMAGIRECKKHEI